MRKLPNCSEIPRSTDVRNLTSPCVVSILALCRIYKSLQLFWRSDIKRYRILKWVSGTDNYIRYQDYDTSNDHSYGQAIGCLASIYISLLCLQAFSVVSLCVLFVSIFSLCASTDPAFKKNMTFEQYAVYFGVEPVELAQAWHDTDYWSMFDWSQYDWFDYSLYYRNYTLSDGNHSHSLNTSSTGTSQSNTSSHWYEYPSYNQSYIQNTSFNVGVTASNTPSTVTSKSSGNSTHLYSLDSLLGAPNPDLMLTDRVCYIFFALEIIARFIFCPSWKKFFTSILNWLDIILIVFYVTEVIINRIMSHEQFHMSAADILFFFRVFRVLRIFRLANHHKGVEVLVHTLKASMREIGLLVLFLFVGVLIFSCLIYFTDHDAQKFKSIGHSFWWAIITMTTVGYGDMYPETAWGKVVGTACALAGVLMIAFTVPIIVNNFMMFYELIEFGKTPTYGNQGTTVSTAKLPSRKVADSTPSHVGAWA